MEAMPPDALGAKVRWLFSLNFKHPAVGNALTAFVYFILPVTIADEGKSLCRRCFFAYGWHLHVVETRLWEPGGKNPHEMPTPCGFPPCRC
jgi:hypothetical protein